MTFGVTTPFSVAGGWSATQRDIGRRRPRDFAHPGSSGAAAGLRRDVGPFFHILRTWTARHKYATAATEELIDLSEQISGRDLSNFFRVWLYTPSKPMAW
jgi:hypothetical protein